MRHMLGLVLISLHLSVAAQGEPSTAEAAAADLIVSKCGKLQSAAREKCVDSVLDDIPPAVMHRANYFAGERMRKADLDRIDAACKKAGFAGRTVRIGMTTKQVRECGWGDPDDVNQTHDRLGTREQWVYGDGNYLYFNNGRLTTIQN